MEVSDEREGQRRESTTVGFQIPVWVHPFLQPLLNQGRVPVLHLQLNRRASVRKAHTFLSLLYFWSEIHSFQADKQNFLSKKIEN